MRTQMTEHSNRPGTTAAKRSALGFVSDLSISKKVLALITAGLVGMIAVAVVGIVGLNKANSTAKRIGSSVAVRANDFGATREAFARMRINLVQAGTFADAAAIQDGLDTYEKKKALTLAGLQAYAAGNLTAKQHTILEQTLIPAINKIIAVSDNTLIPLAKTPHTLAENAKFSSIYGAQIGGLVDTLQGAIDDLSAIDTSVLQKGVKDIDSTHNQAALLLWSILVAVAVLLVAIGLGLVRLIAPP